MIKESEVFKTFLGIDDKFPELKDSLTFKKLDQNK